MRTEKYGSTVISSASPPARLVTRHFETTGAGLVNPARQPSRDLPARRPAPPARHSPLQLDAVFSKRHPAAVDGDCLRPRHGSRFADLDPTPLPKPATLRGQYGGFEYGGLPLNVAVSHQMRAPASYCPEQSIRHPELWAQRGKTRCGVGRPVIGVEDDAIDGSTSAAHRRGHLDRVAGPYPRLSPPSCTPRCVSRLFRI
jgi:hypothetical protein